MKVKLLFLLLWLSPLVVAHAQSHKENSSQDINSEVSFQLGNILPNQVEGVTEITPQVSLRYAHRLHESGFWEVGVHSGSGDGAVWTGASASLRLYRSIESIEGISYIGLDYTRYTGTDREVRSRWGGHIGGGLMAAISNHLWFRSDMKFNSNPGTSLYIGVGFVFRMDKNKDGG